MLRLPLSVELELLRVHVCFHHSVEPQLFNVISKLVVLQLMGN